MPFFPFIIIIAPHHKPFYEWNFISRVVHFWAEVASTLVLCWKKNSHSLFRVCFSGVFSIKFMQFSSYDFVFKKRGNHFEIEINLRESWERDRFFLRDRERRDREGGKLSGWRSHFSFLKCVLCDYLMFFFQYRAWIILNNERKLSMNFRSHFANFFNDFYYRKMCVESALCVWMWLQLKKSCSQILTVIFKKFFMLWFLEFDKNCIFLTSISMTLRWKFIKSAEILFFYLHSTCPRSFLSFEFFFTTLRPVFSTFMTFSRRIKINCVKAESCWHLFIVIHFIFHIIFFLREIFLRNSPSLSELRYFLIQFHFIKVQKTKFSFFELEQFKLHF